MAAVAVAATLPCLAQRTVTLEECYEAAAKNYPLVRQYELIEKSKDYTLSNASKAYLPQVTFSAKASWQSDVTKFNLDRDKLAQSQFGSLITPNELEGMMPTMSKDQYGASIDISQTIWDGGAVKALKDAAASQAEADAKSVDASIYGLRAKINELYFGVILMQSNMDQCDLMLSNLETNYKKVESYIENGVAGQTDLDAIRIQKLKTKQEALNIRNTKSAYLKMLGLLTGIRFEGDTELVKPEPVAVKNEEIQRPELAMYEAQLKALESQNRQITAGLTPKFGLYVSGGYGRPGLNMLDNEFKPYLTAGVRMTWNIGNFYTRKNDMRILETKKSGIEAQRLAFLLNTSIDISGKDSEIKTLREQLEYDDEIIALRKSVLKANEARMAEGTISGSDLVGYMNDERLAEQERTGHEVKLLLAMYNLKHVTNT